MEFSWFVVLFILILGLIVGLVLYGCVKGRAVTEETARYADQIGALVGEDVPCEEFLKPFSCFELMNKYYRSRSAYRRVVYPSDFGDVNLFLYQYADSPPGAPAGSFRCVTVLVCSETLGLSCQSVSNSFLKKLAKKIAGKKGENERLEFLLAGKRRCNLEVSDSGIMLYFKEYIYPPSAISKLIFEFVEMLREIEKLADRDTGTSHAAI